MAYALKANPCDLAGVENGMGNLCIRDAAITIWEKPVRRLAALALTLVAILAFAVMATYVIAVWVTADQPASGKTPAPALATSAW